MNVKRWAEKAFSKYGERAVAMAIVCRQHGLRDLVCPIANIPECLPTLVEKAEREKTCQNGGVFVRGGARAPRCKRPAVMALITDSGLELFLCEACCDKRAVKMPNVRTSEKPV